MPDIGEELVQYAVTRLGKKVGQGECWDLPFHGLQAINAKTPHDLGKNLYVWGEPISLSDARRGDILQFEGVVIRRTWRTEKGTEWKEWSFRDKHSAIVESVNGVFFHLLNQHIGGKKTVTRLEIPLGDEFITRGTIRAYRPIKK